MHMKLMTKELERRFAQVGRDDETPIEDKVIIAKFFNPTGGQTWFATEYDPETRLFFGFVSLFGDHNDEWGSFSLDELQEIKGMFGLGIERDLHYQERKASEEPMIAKTLKTA